MKIKERPLPLHHTLARAVLEERKTQTRRPMRSTHVGYRSFLRWDGAPHRRAMMSCLNGINPESSVFCEDNRLGAPGELLWVRETWHAATSQRLNDLSAVVRYKDGTMRPCWMPPEKRLPLGLGWDRWRPSIHMPRWASRLLLEITDVRVEPLHAISDEDIRSEGFANRADFAQTWRSLYDAPRVRSMRDLDLRHGWDHNPWVWVIAFRAL